MNTQEIIKRAQEVLNIEAKEIQKVSSDISEDFVKAVFEILNCKGRVVLSGIGKSGHIAGKIASTFASTGTPAFFMHPGEASHGDLGMITEDDIVIFLSNSGQSNELVSILPTIKRIGAKIISITGDSSSNLAKQSDIHISVKVTKEACPLGLAPTASSSASLALGDALAICVLDLREFTAEDFARSHPGGSLGKIVLVKDINEISLKKVGFTAVVNSVGKPLGIFTDGDLRRSMLDGIEINSSIDKSMKKNPIILKSDQMAVEALKMMEEMKITAFLVTDANNFLIGALTIQNLFKAKII
jgi:arabinose-5-phosphate isomerase